MIKKSDLLKCESVLQSTSQVIEEDLKITTDSRKCSEANTFISLRGERFDGNEFIRDVIAKGIQIVIFSCGDKGFFEKISLENPKTIFLEVSDTYLFLLELAEVVSSKWQNTGGLVIGITGSNGKTTNKEMLYYLLNEAFPNAVNKTQGNLNNHIGVPLTIFQLTKEHQINLVEMGMNNAGEIYPLAKAARATCGLITSIGPAHLENLKTIDNIFKEKKVLFDWVSSKVVEGQKRCFVVNDRDEYLKKLPHHDWCFHLNEDDLILEKSGFTIIEGSLRFSVSNKSLFGDHNKINLAQCLYLCLKIFPEKTEVLVEAASQFAMPEMNRGDIRTVGDTLIFLDAYNANPASVRSSLDAFGERCVAMNIKEDERLYVLGDMNELGEGSARLHQEVATYLKSLNAVNAFFVGRFAKDYASGFDGPSHLFDEASELKIALQKYLSRYKAVFIKASRSLQLESIVDINDSLT